MTNYTPARLSRLPDEEIVMPKEDDRDYNEEIEMMIQRGIDFNEWENDIYEREEGIA